MSKYKNKVSNWCSSEQHDYLMNHQNILSSEVQLYKLKDEIKFYKSINAKSLYLPNTIKLFNNSMQKDNHELTFFKDIEKTLRSISKDDVAFSLNGKYYLYHTYKLLGFIREPVNALALSSSKDFSQNTVSGRYDNREKEFYSSQFTKHVKRLSELKGMYKGVDLIHTVLYRNLHFRKDFTKYFLSYYAIIGIDNIKLFDNDELESRIIKKALKFFQSGKVTIDDCAKSLLSVLYYYLCFIMRVNKNHALYVAKELVEKVFGKYYEYKGSELIKNVYVKEVIGSHVIYSFDAKNEHITEDNKTFLENIVMNNSLLDINKFPSQVLKPSLDNPLRLYSLITPSELLQKI